MAIRHTFPIKLYDCGLRTPIVCRLATRRRCEPRKKGNVCHQEATDGIPERRIA